ncbi:MAG: hypothetical protein HRT89_04765 [Lentisphaeria bacterium]|nr:hypothetical protein [Lentisphaeria bacterium]
MEINEIKIEVSSSLIRGESPAKIKKTLLAKGATKKDIDEALGDKADIIENQGARKRKRRIHRSIALFILIASVIWNLYVLVTHEVISFLYLAISFYALLASIMGDLFGGVSKVLGSDNDIKNI